jgi:hypothetical protein
MWLQIVATVALQDVGPSARPPAAPRAHRSRCGVWTPPCDDRLGSVQFFPPRIARTDPLSTTVQR